MAPYIHLTLFFATVALGWQFYASPQSDASTSSIQAILAAIPILNSFFNAQSPGETLGNPPRVTLDYGILEGTTNGVVDQFLGVPFGLPPVGPLRFARPVAIPPADSSSLPLINATQYGHACPQQTLDPLPFFVPKPYVGGVDEDCLNLIVVKPAKVKGPLPILFWIFGGGFELGGTEDSPALPIVLRSIAIQQEVIVVSANYRVNAFGFLAGKEVHEAGLANNAIHDQILALDWVHKYIHHFGGDPSKIVLGGVSAGAVFGGLHLLINADTPQEELKFRGVFQHAGGIAWTGTTLGGQDSYDALVEALECTNADSTLECLRAAPYPALMEAINTKTRNTFSYKSFNNTWRPRVDGVLLKENELAQVSAGRLAKVPLLSGLNDDEGSLFALTCHANLTTPNLFKSYIHDNYLHHSSEEEISKVLELYPDDPTQGSPFNTGTASAFSPQYKRLAAFKGDLIYQAPRRLVLQTLASLGIPAWGSINRRGKATSPIGTRHCADAPEWYGLLGNTTGYYGVDSLIRFINTLNPNLRSDGRSVEPPSTWPEYGSDADVKSGGLLLAFLDAEEGGSGRHYGFTRDDFRVEAREYLVSLQMKESVADVL